MSLFGQDFIQEIVQENIVDICIESTTIQNKCVHFDRDQFEGNSSRRMLFTVYKTARKFIFQNLRLIASVFGHAGLYARSRYD